MTAARSQTPLRCPPPPAQLAPFIQVLGIDLAVRFLLAFGGSELTFPADPKGRGAAEAMIGAEAVRILSGMDTVPRRIPLAKPWLAAWLRSRGESAPAIARTLRASDVSVRRWLRAEDRRAERFG